VVQAFIMSFKQKEIIMTTIKIKGMRCGHCTGAVTKALAEIPGIGNVSVNLEKGEATYDETGPVPMDKIKEVIGGIGFEVV
jgi:copper chaperone CopZ